MVEETSERSELDRRLESVLADFQRAVDAGAPVDPATLIGRHPDLAGELRAHFDNLDRTASFVPAKPLQANDRSASATDAPSGEAALASGTLVGSVRLIREVGAGGMGSVWLGNDQVLGRDVAVKFLAEGIARDGESLARFVGEMRAAAAMRHPNLTRIYHADAAAERPYLVMEFVDGPTLGRLLAFAGPLAVPVALAVLEDVADAIGALHEQGLLHRDIKPSNVLLEASAGADPRAVVTDFGLAMPRSALGAAPAIAAGTPLYMAPELHEGASPRSDIYALGLTAFEAFTGRRPFSGTAEQVRTAHASTPLPVEQLASRGVPRELIEVIERATHKQAVFRFKTPGDLLRALKTAASGADGKGTPLQARVDLRRLIHDCRSGKAPPVRLDAPTPTPTPTTVSYAETIGRLAAGKRGIRPRLEVSSADASTAAATTPVVPAAVAPIAVLPIVPPAAAPAPLPAAPVAIDLPCIRCGDNLRGRLDDAPCPACGTPISASTANSRLLFADPRWLKRITAGLLLVLLSPAAIPLVLLGLVIAPMIQSRHGTTAGSASLLLPLLPATAGAMLAIAGVLLSTLRRPKHELPDGTLLCRTAILLFVVAALAANFVDFPTPNGTSPARAAEVTLTATCAIALAAAICFAYHLGSLGGGSGSNDGAESLSPRWLRHGGVGLFVASAVAYAVFRAFAAPIPDDPPIPLSPGPLLVVALLIAAAAACLWAATLLTWRALRRILRQQRSFPSAL